MISNILKVALGIILFGNIGITFAATIDHFEVTVSPEKIAIGEAVDLTIDAVDKDSNIITDYEGTILIFSESDREAEFPNSLEDNSYTFKLSDEGHIKFENAVRFQNKGKNDIHVYDLGDETDSVMGLAEVEVTEKVEEQNVEITILSPENGLTIGKKEITVSGKTKKNHQVKIILNAKEEILTTSNKDGIFEKVIENLPGGKSIIKASVLDGDNKEVGTSKEVHITSDSNNPTFNKIKVSPAGEVEVESNIQIEVYATKGLSDVSIILNDELNPLIESDDGVYKTEILSPKEVGEYPIDVILKDELGHIIKELEAETISTVEKELPAAKEEDVCEEGDYSGDVFDGECGTKPNTPDVCENGDNSGDLYDNKCEKIDVRDTCDGGDFSGDFFDGKCESGQVKDKCKLGDYSGDVFDGECGTKAVDFNAPIDLGIKNLKLVELKTKSVLTWDTLEDAVKYEVYKKLEGDEIELIDVVTNPRFEIAITGDQIKHEYFAVKAIGKKEFIDTENGDTKIEKEIKGDLSDAIKIQTGPKEIIIILLALLLGGAGMILMRKKA